MNDILNNHQYDLKTMERFKDEYPEQDFRTESASCSNAHERMHSLLYHESLLSVDPDTLDFNESQKYVYDTISACVLGESPDLLVAKVFFVDGPGGTSKTFLFNVLLGAVRRRNKITIAVAASTGTSALLLKGGRTAHFTFEIPLDVTSISMCNLTPKCALSQFIVKSSLIVWDECSMASKELVEAVDRTFRDITKINAPFDGQLMVFGGDFRQVLPSKLLARGQVSKATG
ncbi:hypothetical protein G6F42_021381 [Rhizopus arrhizus]|nr:hypothetical protein G6F42_021381 [Rhizopus arrhizus]